jgi:fructose-bisphosphate aldolase, class II
MTLVSIKNELLQARQQSYAVLLTDVVDIPGVEGMLAALKARQIPGIIALYGGMLNQPHAQALVRYILQRVGETNVPVSLMLDHGSSLEQCLQAIAWGFSDVMFDGSSLPLQENLDTSRLLVEKAHAAGVGVEAELGHVGLGSEYTDYGGKRKGFTDPLEAGRFARETGVDYLAVAIGTAHGIYQGEPNVDLDLLAEIRQYVPVPLVLHGGTGLSSAQFQAAIAAGISKINVATDMFINAGQRLAQAAREGESNYFRLTQVSTRAFQERCEFYLDLFRPHQ